MSVHAIVTADNKVAYEDSYEYRVDIVDQLRARKDGEPPSVTMDQEKRMRREIANSNERRRMQSINNGFQSLRSLLPHHEGEKLSKAAILQQTAEYIYNLEQEKTLLLSQNCQLKRLVNQHEGGELPPKKRKTEVILPTISESSDEGLSMSSPEMGGGGINSVVGDSITDLRRQMERERSLRLSLEEQVRQLENQLYQQQQVYTVDEDADDIDLQLISSENVPPIGHTQTIVCTSSPINSRSSSPTPASPSEQQRLPSVLEAAIKAEPKVEVERLPSPSAPTPEDNKARIYVANTSRQNLETIVEAIRHLEGDHLFGDEPQPQEAPLALTTRPPPASKSSVGVVCNGAPASTAAVSLDCVKIEVSQPFVEFLHTPHSIQHQQQTRPGVIMGKQSS